MEKSDFNFENEESITVFSENIFIEAIQDIIHPNFFPINSYFTDEQAKSICTKISNKRIRYFSSLFLTENPDIDHQTLKYQIHFIANKALSFYGGKILTFIFSLKNWKPRSSNVEVLKMNQRGLENSDPNFPKLTFRAKEGDQQIEITFSRAYERYGNDYIPLGIKNIRNIHVAKISKNGRLIEDFQNCIPIIAIFKEILNERFLLYSGYDDDLCDICNRPLEDAVSIKYGRGPTCRKNYGNPF